jgi:hypothetical protein
MIHVMMEIFTNHEGLDFVLVSLDSLIVSSHSFLDTFQDKGA